MDLSTLSTNNAETGAVMKLRHPLTDEVLLTDKGKEITITMLGADSSKYRKKQYEIQNARVKSMMKNKDKKGFSFTENTVCELLASCVVGWHGIVYDGKELKHTEENALMLFKTMLWVREQVDEFVEDRTNFFTES